MYVSPPLAPFGAFSKRDDAKILEFSYEDACFVDFLHV